MRTPRAHLDESDLRILELLQQDSAQPAAEVARVVGLSPSAVRRRIDRLRRRRVIQRFTIVLDHARIGDTVEAFVEVTFATTADSNPWIDDALDMAAVREVSRLAGDPDALVRLRVRDLVELEGVVHQLRHMKPGTIAASKTLVVLRRRRRIDVGTGVNRPARLG